MTDPHHRPSKPPKPGISSANASVVLIGAGLDIKQSGRIVEQTAEISQTIKPIGMELKIMKSSVSVYFGIQVVRVNITPSISLIVGTDQGISGSALDSQGNTVAGRPISMTNSNPSVCTATMTGTSAIFNINLHPLAAGTCQISVTCDGVVGTCNVTVTGVSSGLIMFQDNFAGGVRAPAQNGVNWTSVTDSDPTQGSNVAVRPDPGSPSGYALGFEFFQTTLVPRQDANIDQRFHLPDMFGVYIEFTVYCDAAYSRRTNNPNNHKLIRVWDQDYTDSNVHLGCSSDAGGETVPGSGLSDHGNLVMEYCWANGVTGQMGPHGKGPFTQIFFANREVTIGVYIRQESAYLANDGLMQAWVNRTKVYDNPGIRTWLNSVYPNHANVLRNGHIMGTANYGWPAKTIMYVRSFMVASAYPY